MGRYWLTATLLLVSREMDAERIMQWWALPENDVEQIGAVPDTPMHAFFEHRTFQSVAGDFHFFYGVPHFLYEQDKQAKGLFLMLHACQRGAGAFFHLPEESAMAAAALKRGYAVAAPDAPPHPGHCWDVAKDTKRLALALPEARAQLGLQDAPLYGMGISTGGMVLASLVQTFGVVFNGVHFNAAPHSADLFLQATSPWPRTSFAFERGDQWAKPDVVQQSASFLNRVGTPVQVVENEPHPLDDLPKLSPVLNISRSALVQATKAIHTSGLTMRTHGPDGASREFLAPNVVNAAFKKVVQAPGLRSLLKGEYKAMREELTVMDASNGPSAERIDSVLDFLLEEGAYVKQSGAIVLMTTWEKI